MIKTCLFILTLGLATSALASGPSGPGPTPVVGFDAKSYLGAWYEIGSIPQSFQKGCACTRATYSLRSDARLDVVNECRKKGINGEVTVAKGVARFKNSPTVGDLEVSFFLWFYGSYRIIALDQERYEWSVVSNDKAKTLWILSRFPEMSSSQLSRLLELARQQGVDTSLFQKQNQAGCWLD